MIKNKFIKYLIMAVNLLLVLALTGFILGLVFLLPPVQAWLQGQGLTIQSPLGVSTAGNVFVIAEIIYMLLTLLALYFIRQFLTNVYQEQIFTDHNIKLARYSALTFLLMGISIYYGFEDSSYSLATAEEVMRWEGQIGNSAFLLAAAIIYVLSLILEKGLKIAQENEFTI